MRKALVRLDRLQSGWANEDRTRLEQAEATAHARASAKERVSKNYQRDADPLAMAVAHNTADVSGGGGKVAARRWQGGGRLVLVGCRTSCLLLRHGTGCHTPLPTLNGPGVPCVAHIRHPQPAACCLPLACRRPHPSRKPHHRVSSLREAERGCGARRAGAGTPRKQRRGGAKAIAGEHSGGVASFRMLMLCQRQPRASAQLLTRTVPCSLPGTAACSLLSESPYCE